MRDVSATRWFGQRPLGGASHNASLGARTQTPLSSVTAPMPQPPRLGLAMSIAIRPAKKGDAGALARYFQALSSRSRLQRFHGAVNQLPEAMVSRFAENGRPGELTLLAVLIGGESEAIVGEACYFVLADGHTAEFALSVTDAAQGIGLGRRLLHALMREAAAQGVDVLRGEVMPENEPMLALAQSMGFDASRSRSDARLRRIERMVEVGFARV